MIAVIKSDPQYREVLDRVSALAQADPVADSAEGRELEVLALLLRDYERRAFPLAPPSPIAAIRLRMDQLGLLPKDLTPFLGSRSKASEVLAGKRPLSLSMIRELHRGLGIPLASLVPEEVNAEPTERIEWDRFPVREMGKKRWIDIKHLTPSKRISFTEAREVMEGFFKPVGGPTMAAGVLHKTDCVRTARSTDRFALAAWAAFILRTAEGLKPNGTFLLSDWTEERLRELRSLSRYDVGPRLAVQFLSERGVIVVIEPHLKRTRLDGAAMLRSDGTPVIGLTVRHDRADNFWFTLFHELMHVLLHLKSETARNLGHSLYLDDLDLDIAPDVSPLENEADKAAREALLTTAEWQDSAARFAVAPATVEQLARRVGVSEAIVAGRVRFERRNYRLLSSMVGPGQVRSLFPDIQWPAETP